MPDAGLMLWTSSLAAVAAMAVVLLLHLTLLRGGKAGLPGREWAGAESLGVATALLTGACLLGLAPQWPPREGQDRLLLVLLPAAVAVEVVAGLFYRIPWLAWALRGIVAAVASPLLLHGSVYISDSAGNGARSWPGAEMWWILGGLAAALAVNWLLLDRLAQRRAGRSVLLGLALAAGGSGVTIMLSAYATGGQLGLPLAAGLIGVAVAAPLFSEASDLRRVVGVGVVSLFGLLILGRFFGELTTTNAVLLFGAPLLAWVPELVSSERIGPWLRAWTRVALVAIPIAVALALATLKFNDESGSPAARPGLHEPSSDDYGSYGK
jgi:hypothetical protein